MHSFLVANLPAESLNSLASRHQQYGRLSQLSHDNGMPLSQPRESVLGWNNIVSAMGLSTLV